MTNQITFTSHIHEVLFNNEISGQLSDGHWSNSTPRDHWRLPCDAKVLIGDVASVNFYVSRRYCFTAKPLLDVVSDRMITFVKLAMRYPELSCSAIRLSDYGSWIWDKQYYEAEKLELAAIGITDAESFAKCISELASIKYTLKDLKKDLKLMQVPFDRQYVNTHG